MLPEGRKRVRSLALAERLRLDFKGNVNAAAIALGDIDNDQNMELVVGNVQGDLAVFKGSSPHPWKLCRELGTITALAIGDIYNQQRNTLVCINAEGFCHLFDFHVSSAHERTDIEPVAQWRLPVPVNIRRAMVADVDADGWQELVVARTDRFVHVYRLHFLSQTLSPITSTFNIAATTSAAKSAQMRRSDPVEGQLLQKQEPSSAGGQDQPVSSTSSSIVAEEKQTRPSRDRSTSTLSLDTLSVAASTHTVPPSARASLMEQGRWSFQSQVGGLEVLSDGRGWLVGQAGANWTRIDTQGHTNAPGDHQIQESPLGALEATAELVVCDDDHLVASSLDGVLRVIPLSRIVEGDSMQKENQGETKGNKENQEESIQAEAVKLQDNEVMEKRHNKDSSPYICMSADTPWIRFPQHHFFALCKWQHNSAVSCAWDGSTWFLNAQGHLLKFDYPERVCAFVAGEYSLSPGSTEWVLVYLGFQDEIHVYYHLDDVQPQPPTDFIHTLKEQNKSLSKSRLREALYQPMVSPSSVAAALQQ